MADYAVAITGLDGILAKLRPALYLPAVAELIRSAAMLAERTARQGAPRDTAALVRSITSDVQPMAARVYSTLSYAEQMESGRRAGARMPPPQALAGWAGRHGYPPTAVWALARAIARRGIRGRFFFKAAVTAVTNALPSLTQEAARRIDAAWGAR